MAPFTLQTKNTASYANQAKNNSVYPERNGRRLLESGFFRLLESGGYRLLEASTNVEKNISNYNLQTKN